MRHCPGSITMPGLPGLRRLLLDGVSGLLPRQQTTLHIVNAGEAVAAQEIGDLPAAIAAATGDNHGLVGRDFAQAGRNLTHRDKVHAGDVSGSVFFRLAHVDQNDIIPPLKRTYCGDIHVERQMVDVDVTRRCTVRNDGCGCCRCAASRYGKRGDDDQQDEETLNASWKEPRTRNWKREPGTGCADPWLYDRMPGERLLLFRFTMSALR